MNVHAHMRSQMTAHKTFWVQELAERFGQTGVGIDALRFPLSAFAHHIRVELADGSTLDLEHAFFLVSQEKQAVGIFTEHSGYFTFSLYSISIHQDGQLVFQGPE